MRVGTSSVVVCAALLLHAGIAGAQQRSLTLADVLARAREQAPQIASARLALEEARGRLVGASLRFQQNPEVDATVGNRQRPTAGSRTSRSASGRPSSLGRDVRLESPARTPRSTSIGGCRRNHPGGPACRGRGVLPCRSREGTHRLLAATEDLAARVYTTADRRFRAGDIAVLDVNSPGPHWPACGPNGRRRRRRGPSPSAS